MPNLSLAQISLSAIGDLNLNTRHNPDCGNFGEAAEFGGALPKKRGAQSRLVALRSNSGLAGMCCYKIGTGVGSFVAWSGAPLLALNCFRSAVERVLAGIEDIIAMLDDGVGAINE